MSKLQTVKNKFDPRHLKRIKNFQALFAWGCGGIESKTEEFDKIVKVIPKIDLIIQENAPKWPLDKINHIAIPNHCLPINLRTKSRPLDTTTSRRSP